MLRWLKSLFICEPTAGHPAPPRPPASVPVLPESVDDPDPMKREAIARAFNTGKPVVGNYRPDGTFEIRELDGSP